GVGEEEEGGKEEGGGEGRRGEERSGLSGEDDTPTAQHTADITDTHFGGGWEEWAVEEWEEEEVEGGGWRWRREGLVRACVHASWTAAAGGRQRRGRGRKYGSGGRRVLRYGIRHSLQGWIPKYNTIQYTTTQRVPPSNERTEPPTPTPSSPSVFRRVAPVYHPPHPPSPLPKKQKPPQQYQQQQRPNRRTKPKLRHLSDSDDPVAAVMGMVGSGPWSRDAGFGCLANPCPCAAPYAAGHDDPRRGCRGRATSTQQVTVLYSTQAAAGGPLSGSILKDVRGAAIGYVAPQASSRRNECSTVLYSAVDYDGMGWDGDGYAKSASSATHALATTSTTMVRAGSTTTARPLTTALPHLLD
ncbi:hypothetical protein V500_08741, partial [Pseudogymnoascus sp. VKM F-4518 (FW-2643)]